MARRKTTTLYKIIKGELHRAGVPEFFKDNQMIFFSDTDSYMKKCMRYDEDVEEIVNNKVFQHIYLKEDEYDKHFKKMFLNEFLNKQIKTQTLEAFSQYVVSVFMQNEDYLNAVYENYFDFLTGNTNSKGNSKSKNRNANQNLPQNQVNLDLNDDTFEFANDNSISNNSNEHDTNSRTFNPERAEKGSELLTKVLEKFEKKCFLQVFI